MNYQLTNVHLYLQEYYVAYKRKYNYSLLVDDFSNNFIVIITLNYFSFVSPFLKGYSSSLPFYSVLGT